LDFKKTEFEKFTFNLKLIHSFVINTKTSLSYKDEPNPEYAP
jgi:hypothetical protein